MSVKTIALKALLTLVSSAAKPMSAQARFTLLARLGRALVPEYRFKWPQMQWWHDRDFSDYLQRFTELDGFNTDRRLMVHELIRLVADVPGDTVECGVFKGAGSYVICAANLQSPGRTHHIFDSFEGLSTPTHADGQYWEQGNLAVGMAQVENNLRSFNGVEYHPGWIPERFSDVANHTFAFVHVDVDLAQPTEDSFKFFYPRVNAGGIILCDDYGFTTCPGATEVIDRYLSDKPEKMIRLSAGGGFMIKGCRTSMPPLSFLSQTVATVAG